MSRPQGPELTKYIDKQLNIKLNGRREVTGVLRGFDQFMNLVVDDAQEVTSDKGDKQPIGQVIRGNSILMIEALERV